MMTSHEVSTTEARESISGRKKKAILDKLNDRWYRTQSINQRTKFYPQRRANVKRTLNLSTTAATFDRGVLASRLASLVARPTGHAISETDRSDVAAAMVLISELLSGVKGLSSRDSINDASARGIKSLGLALTPLEELRNSLRGPDQPSDVTEVLSAIKRVLSQLLRESSVPTKNQELKVTEMFFASLADSLLSSLSRVRLSQERPSRW
jgi:hypothetical protein